MLYRVLLRSVYAIYLAAAMECLLRLAGLHNCRLESSCVLWQRAQEAAFPASAVL